MSDQNLPVLTEQQARVLFEVWKNKQSKNSKGMNNNEIRDAVQRDFFPDNDRGTSLSNIKKIIQQLAEWQPTPLLVPSRAGRTAVVFRLPKDSMVTWSTSAQMLLALDGDPHDSVEHRIFVQKIQQLNLRDHDTGELLTAEDIENQIDYCKDQHFPYIDEDQKGILRTTDRVNQERAFLEKIQNINGL